MSDPNITAHVSFVARDAAAWLPQSFDDPLCDAPAFLDPLHPAEASCRCQLRAGHPATVNHLGYVIARWPASAPYVAHKPEEADR